jgi:hypothetical protein
MSSNFLSEALGIKTKVFNPNPDQETDSSEDRYDCSIRAICGLTGESWENVYTGLFRIGLARHRMLNTPYVAEEYLSEYGFIDIKSYLNDITNPLEFMYKYKNGEYIMIIPGHTFYYSDGTLYDNAHSIKRQALYSSKIMYLFVCVNNLLFKDEIAKALCRLEETCDTEAFHVDALKNIYNNALDEVSSKVEP